MIMPGATSGSSTRWTSAVVAYLSGTILTWKPGRKAVPDSPSSPFCAAPLSGTT